MLTADDRAAAPCIHQALQWAAAAAASDQPPTPEVLRFEVKHHITAGGGRVDYVEVSVLLAPLPSSPQYFASLAPLLEGQYSAASKAPSQSKTKGVQRHHGNLNTV